MCYMVVSAIEQNIKQWSMINIVENIVLVDKASLNRLLQETSRKWRDKHKISKGRKFLPQRGDIKCKEPGIGA